MIAGATEVVYQDEKNHYKEAAKQARRPQSAGPVGMRKTVQEISLQRVHMRNEMFKEPLTSDEIDVCLACIRDRVEREF